MTRKSTVTAAELQKHASPESCWLLINGVVWDLTEFAPAHPGGAQSKSNKSPSPDKGQWERPKIW